MRYLNDYGGVPGSNLSNGCCLNIIEFVGYFLKRCVSALFDVHGERRILRYIKVNRYNAREIERYKIKSANTQKQWNLRARDRKHI